MRLKFAPVLADNLMKLVTHYMAARAPRISKVSLRSVSRQAHGDPPFFEKLMAGECSFTIRKYDEMIDWFDTNWPTNTKRPKLVDPRHGPLRRKPVPRKRKVMK